MNRNLSLVRYAQARSNFAAGDSAKRPGRALRRAVLGTVAALGVAILVPLQAFAQNPDFNVTVNAGPVAPNATTIFPGEPTSLRVTLANNSLVNPITNASFTRDMQLSALAGLVVDGASVIAGDAGCINGTLTTNEGSQTIQLAGLTIPPRVNGVPGSGECYLDVPIRAFVRDGQSTALNFDLPAGAVSANEGVNASGGPQSFTVRATQRPTVEKEFGVGGNTLIINGASRTLVVTVNNPDPNVDLEDVSFSDVFPGDIGDGAFYEPTGVIGGSCTAVAPAPTITPTQGAAAGFSVSGLTVASGTSCTIEVEVRARHSGGDFDTTANNQIAAAGFDSRQGLRPAADASTPAVVRSPLALNKSFSPSTLASGTQGQFSVTLTNASNAPLQIARFDDDPIENTNSGNLLIENVGDVSTVCSDGPGAVGTPALLNGGTGFEVTNFAIPANGNCVVSVTYRGVSTTPDAPTSYNNVIPEGNVDVDEAPGDPEIVSEATSASVIIADRLRIRKERTPGNAAPGESVRYRVTVQNFSDAPLANVTVDDTFQNGSTLLTGAGFEPTLTPACGVLDTNGLSTGDTSATFTLPTVPARTGPGSPGACVVTFFVMIDPDATTNTPNVVGAGDVCFNGGATCNASPSNTVNTVLRDPVEFSKTFNTVEVVNALEGVPVRMRLELRNFAAQGLTDLAFSDTLPTAGPLQQLTIAPLPNVSNSCGGAVDAVAGTNSITLNNGTVAAFSGGNPGVCQVEVDVVGPAGTYVNTAQATGNRPNADGSITPITPVGVALEDDATVNYLPALEAAKSFTPDSAADGSVSTLEIRFNNLDTDRPITGITVTDNLPTGMVIADPPVAYSTCAGPPVVTAVPGGTSLAISGATLPAGANCAVLANVLVSGTADWVNVIPAGDLTADNGIVSTAPIEATLRFEPPGVPLISKAVSPGTIVPGQSSTLTIDVTNGAQALSGVSLVDWFTQGGVAGAADNGMTIAPSPQASTNCPGGIVTAVPGENSVRLSGASLAANQACEISVQVTSTTVGTLVNRIPLNAIESDQGATNSTTFAESTLSTTSEIGISKLFTPAVVSMDEPSRLRIEFFNGSVNAVTNFALEDVYPAGLVNAPDPNPITSCGAATLTQPTPSSIAISNGTLPGATGGNAASCFVEVNVVSSTEGTYLNEIPADTLTVNGLPVTHPPADSTLQVRERIVVNKAFDNQTLDTDPPAGFATGNAVRLPGIAAPLTIRLENPNDLELTQVAFSDELPDGLTLAVPPNLATSCPNGVVTGVPNGRTLTLTGATLGVRGGPTATCTVTADVFSNLPGVYTNEIPAGAVTSFEGVDNDPPTQSQLVVSNPPTVAKDFNPPVVAPGSVSTLRITLGNDNDIDGTLTADLVDRLPTSPGAMVIATPANITSSCPGGVGVVDSASGDSELTIQSGTVIPAGGCFVTVDVTATEPGDYQNTIPVAALQTTLGPNDRETSATLRLSTLGYIAGKVFLDNQDTPNGVFVPGDSAPIAGNLIELRSGADCSGAVIATTTTDAQGNYLFSDLPAGTYSVCQPTQPPDTLNSVTTEGTIETLGASSGTPGVAANPSTLTSQITGIVLGDNAGVADEVSGSPNNDFSEVVPASLSGNVFFDANDDGVFDGGETGIGGVVIELTGPVTRTTTTAADGSWSFDDLPPGSYTVTEIQPDGWTDGQDAPGTVDGGTVGNGANDLTSNVTLGPGDAGVDYNFGEVIVAGAPGAPSFTANAVCVNDAIYVDYRFEGFGDSTPPSFDLRWLTPGGRVAEQLTNQPGSGRLLWPGTVVDGAGVATGWPGWAFVDGAWIEVTDDRVPEMVLETPLGGGFSVALTYPGPRGSCAAQPPGTFEPVAVPASPLWSLLLLALSLLATAWRFAPQHQMLR